MFQHPWEPLPDQRAISERAAHEHALTVAVRDQRRHNRRRSTMSRLREWWRKRHFGADAQRSRQPSLKPGAQGRDLTSDTAGTFTVHEVSFRPSASGDDGSGELEPWRIDCAPHTTGEAPRTSREVILFILDGTLDIDLDGLSFRARQSQAVLVPAQARLSMSNNQPTTAQAWGVTVAA